MYASGMDFRCTKKSGRGIRKNVLWRIFTNVFVDNFDIIMGAIIIYASGKAVGMTTDELKNLYYTYKVSLSSRDEHIFLLLKHLSEKSKITILKLVRIIVNAVHRVIISKYGPCVSKRKLSIIIMNYLKNFKND